MLAITNALVIGKLCFYQILIFLLTGVQSPTVDSSETNSFDGLSVSRASFSQKSAS